MDNSTPKTLTKKLLQYGSLTAAFAATGNIQGQIVYTDIDPDAGGFGMFYNLDLNNDGQRDFAIYTGEDVNMMPTNRLYVAGSFYPNSPGVNNSFQGAGYQPFALDSGAVISAGQSFNGFIASLNIDSCTTGNFCDVTDKFLGLKFDIAGSDHYGWARLTVDAAGMEWTIKDYAYNSVAGASIMAGEGTVLSTEESSLARLSITAIGKSISLRNLPAQSAYKLINMSGQELLRGNLQTDATVIEVPNVANGVYVFELADATTGNVTRKKIFL